MLLSVLLAAAAVCSLASAGINDKPNIIIVLTDDQDALLNSTMKQPNLLRLVRDQGINFVHGFANTPVCCPSRSSLLTGKYTHNHGALNNSIDGNCTSPAWEAALEPDALAVHVHRQGYRTLYAGKYLNQAHTPGGVPPQFKHDPFKYIPPGWTDWYGLQGNSKYYNYSVSNNGTREDHGYNYENDYFTLQLHKRAIKFLQDVHAADSPFLMWIGTPSAHANFIPAPQHWPAETDSSQAPRTPNFNQVCEHCHNPLPSYPKMTDAEVKQTDDIFRRRLGTLQSVDDMVGAIYEQLEAMGQVDNTYFFYTGDHGFHLGQWAQGFDKRQLYEADIRVPYFVRGPGVPAGVTRTEPISHVDLAPTVIDIVSGSVPANWDGRSYKQLLSAQTYPHAAQTWDPRVLIQYFGEGGVGEMCGNGIGPHVSAPGSPYPGHELAPIDYDAAPCDSWNNTYTCQRQVAVKPGDIDHMFCQFTCFHPRSKQVIPCPMDNASGKGEYYKMDGDPWQMTNAVESLTPQAKQALNDAVSKMGACSGQQGCQWGA
eukprot:m.232969 g.232969  ORF g.232969 m.232969 type:complete len:540 (+) comp22451_c0_seq9:744-2363(+)